MLCWSPGAVRQHWRSALRQQLSQRRAEERREAEETRRLYSEDVSPLDEEEEEGELSDRDTTGEGSLKLEQVLF